MEPSKARTMIFLYLFLDFRGSVHLPSVKGFFTFLNPNLACYLWYILASSSLPTDFRFHQYNELHSHHPRQLVPSWPDAGNYKVLTVISPDSQVHPAAILALHLNQSDSLLTCWETLPTLLSQRGIKCSNTHTHIQKLIIQAWKLTVLYVENK